ncbi:MAG: hypothetical protein M0R17_14935 [Candidatus Omnitrophica bacterium]|jgi:hypothetical protein|nr:hypothetical protein [Candidatus Omnitrophota bacterium]
MKKVLFVILALCFVSSLALAQEAAKPADDKAVVETGAASGVVVVSDEAKTDAAVVTDETKMTEEEKAAADKAAVEKVASETVKK